MTVVDKGILKTFLVDRAPRQRLRAIERPRPGGAGLRARVAAVEPGRRVEQVAFRPRSCWTCCGTKRGSRASRSACCSTTSKAASPTRAADRPTPSTCCRTSCSRSTPTRRGSPSWCAASISSARRSRRSAKIVATGDKVDIFNGVCGAESGGVPVSASSPPLLVSEVEVQKKAQSQEPLPILAGAAAGGEVLTCEPTSVAAVAWRPLGAPAVAFAGAARAGVADSLRDARRDDAVDGRAADEGRAGAVLHRVRNRRHRLDARHRAARRHRRRRRRITRGRCASRCGSATTQFDSSRFVTQDRGAGGCRRDAPTVPLDDNYDAIRREIWLTTDAAYKRAVSVFAKKKAAFQNRAATDQIPDFSRETPVQTVLPVSPPAPTDRRWVDRAKQLSAVFVGEPGHRLVRGLDFRGARHELLSEQRRLQGRHAGLDRRTSASPPTRGPTTA